MTMPEPTNEEEAFRRLIAVNPVPAEVVEGAGFEPTAAGAHRIIENRKSRRPWWRRRAVVIPLVIGLAGATAAAAYTLTRPVTNTVEVGCFSGPSLSSVEHGTALTGSPVATCSRLWEAGAFGRPTLPPLVECVEPSGAAVVFPTRNVGICSELRLAVPGKQVIPEKEAVEAQQLTRQLGSIVLGTSCLPPGAARSDALRWMERDQLKHWRVVSAGQFTSSQPCSSFAITSARREVQLIPQARHPG